MTKAFETHILDQGSADAISLAAESLLAGELVAFPTETVYGLGANIYDEEAVRRIFSVKGRPADNPLIVHIAAAAEAEELAMDVPDTFYELAERFFPGPLTMVLKRNAAVLDIVTAGLETVAVRMPAHPAALDLIRAAGVPLAAPSANVSGKASPVTARQVFDDLSGKIRYILDGGACAVGIESTVIDLTSAIPAMLRPGMISREDIEETLDMEIADSGGVVDAPRSPGMKYRHYEPNVPMILIPYSPVQERRLEDALRLRAEQGKRIALLAPDGYRKLTAHGFYSFGEGTPVEYARGLYSALRQFQPGEVDYLYCLGIAEEGPGMAVMNRLRKAAAEVME